MRSFDRIASLYEVLERITLANTLQSARCLCLPHLSTQKRGLLIGDGDGRFSEQLLKLLPEIEIDSVDISARMLELAKRRAADNATRLNTIQQDALRFEYPKNNYDFIGLHFCLDCFSQKEIDSLIPPIESSLKPDGIIAYSDFQTLTSWHKATVRMLYFCFRQTTGLAVSQLPRISWSPSLQVIAQKEYANRLVFSKLLQKRTTAGV